MSDRPITGVEVFSGSIHDNDGKDEDQLLQNASPTLQDLHEFVVDQQRKLQSSIKEEHALLLNNAPPPQKSDDSFSSAEMCDSRAFMQCYRNQVVQGNHFDIPDLSDKTQQLFVATNLLTKLREENKQMEKLISHIENDLKILDDEISEKDKEIMELEEITARMESGADVKQETKMDVKYQKARKLFNTFKVMANDMISECFADHEDNLKDILQDMIGAFFEGSSMYCEVPGSDKNAILALLVESNVLVRHPYDPNKLRLNTAF